MTGASSRSLKVTEADFQAAVIDLAHVLGWTAAHFRPARTETGWRNRIAFRDAWVSRP
jgi:hypothetical protein